MHMATSKIENSAQLGSISKNFFRVNLLKIFSKIDHFIIINNVFT
jgi:hypothetical protein